MNRTYKFCVFGLLILSGTIFYLKDSFVLKINTKATINNVKNQTNDINNTLLTDNEKNISSSISEKIQGLPNISYIDEDIETLSQIYSNCGYDVTSKQSIMTRIKKSSKKPSIKQSIAQEIILDECENWYSFIDNLSKEQLEIQKTIFDDYGNLIEHLNPFNNKGEDFKQVLKDSRETLRANTDSSMITIGALANLLNQDYDFIGEIAENIGTQNLKFLTGNSYYIAFLYACEINPQECSPSSMQMLSLCVSFEDACGLSYTNYYAGTVSQNQFIDMMNAVSIIIQLINHGYFE